MIDECWRETCKHRGLGVAASDGGAGEIDRPVAIATGLLVNVPQEHGRKHEAYARVCGRVGVAAHECTVARYQPPSLCSDRLGEIGQVIPVLVGRIWVPRQETAMDRLPAGLGIRSETQRVGRCALPAALPAVGPLMNLDE